MYVGHFLERNSILYRNKTALKCGAYSVTFEELRNRTTQLAKIFMSLGLDQGERVALLDYNSIQFMEILLGVSISGLVAVPLNFRLSTRELKIIINDSTCKALVYNCTFAPSIEEMKNDLTSVQRFICIDGNGEMDFGHEASLPCNNDKEMPVLREENPLYILYTSGTTGMPKGAVLTHHSMLNVMRNNIIEQSIVPENCFIQVAPLFHVAPLQIFFSHLYQGCTCVIMQQFDPEAMMEIIQNNRITSTFLVPRMLSAIHDHPKLKDYDLSSLSTITYGGAYTPLEQLKEFLQTWGLIMLQVYGSTETGLVTVLKKQDHILNEGAANHLGSCGRAALDVQLKIVDSSGRPAKIGEIGEILVKSEGTIQEYWQKPSETNECMKNSWFQTGDMGYMDNDGYLFIVDRKKDMIISGGENIYPAEIENVLYMMPEIMEAAVVGIPDKKWGATVKAVVVLKEKCYLTEEQVIDFCKQNLASYKKPTSVDFVSELPKNASGKILKRVLRDKCQTAFVWDKMR